MSKSLEDIIRDHFGIDPDVYSVHTENIYKKHDPENFLEVKAIYEKNLESHPNREIVAKQLYIDDDIIVHMFTYFPSEDVAAITKDSLFYYPLCTIDEILRIENPQTASDYLLKIRADSIADEPRLARIFLSRKEKYLGDWSLSNYYMEREFSEYVNRLTPGHAEVCEGVPAGFALLREPNGACISTQAGKIIIVSESLRHFLFYMNVFLFSDNLGIAADDRNSALFIGIRTMLQTETPDFDLDSRGELPEDVEKICQTIVADQIKFVIGHEYAHLLLNHFDSSAITSAAGEILLITPTSGSPVYYTPRQQQEFDADAGSVLHADYTDKERADVLNAATIFFLHLDLFYVVSDYVNPSFGRIKTHPDPIERIWELRRSVSDGSPIFFELLYSDSDIHDWIKYVQHVKAALVKDVLPYHIDQLEAYSSIYMPGFKREFKHDRFDF